jgi:hypothetical protein
VNFIEAAVMPKLGPKYSERLCGQRGPGRFFGRGRRSVDVVLRQLELLAEHSTARIDLVNRHQVAALEALPAVARTAGLGDATSRICALAGCRARAKALVTSSVMMR